MINKFNIFFLTFFYIGRIKYAPGTFASLLTCIIFIVLNNFFNNITIFIFTLIIFLYSFISINYSFTEFNEEDPQEIVIDEVIGQMLPLLAIPVYKTLFPMSIMYYCIASFIFFRIFDIWKPFPVNYVDNNIKGSLGIILDDIIAGLYSIIILCILFQMFL